MARPELRTSDQVQDEAEGVMGRRPGESLEEWMKRLNGKKQKRKNKRFKRKNYGQ